VELELSKEQLQIIVNTIRPSDIITHIENNLLRYEAFIKDEYSKGLLNSNEFEYELRLIENIKNKEVNHNELMARVC